MSLQKPGHKAAVRRSQAQAAKRAKSFNPLTQPHFQTLLEKNRKLKQFVKARPKLKDLLSRPLEDIVVVRVCVS